MRMHLFKAIEVTKFISIKTQCEPNSKKENKNMYPLTAGSLLSNTYGKAVHYILLTRSVHPAAVWKIYVQEAHTLNMLLQR